MCADQACCALLHYVSPSDATLPFADADEERFVIYQAFQASGIRWPASLATSVQPMEIWQQHLQSQHVALTMLMILKHDPMYPIHDIQSDQAGREHPVPCAESCGTGAIAWPVLSSKDCKALTAILTRVLTVLWWAREGTHERNVCEDEDNIPMHIRLQETLLKILDHLLRGTTIACCVLHSSNLNKLFKHSH